MLNDLRFCQIWEDKKKAEIKVYRLSLRNANRKEYATAHTNESEL